MDQEYVDWERTLTRELTEFLHPETKRKPAPPACVAQRETYRVELAVRMKRLAMDYSFVHTSERQSRLEAKIEAEAAARKAGWPIIGHLQSITRL